MFPKCFTLCPSQMWKMLSKRRRVVTRVHTHLPLPWLGLWQLWWGHSLLSVSLPSPTPSPPPLTVISLCGSWQCCQPTARNPFSRLVLVLGSGFTKSVDMGHEQWHEIEFLLCWHCWPKSIYISATDQILRRIPFIFCPRVGAGGRFAIYQWQRALPDLSY